MQADEISTKSRVVFALLPAQTEEGNSGGPLAFDLSVVTDAAALPLTLESFVGKPEGEHNRFEWTTVHEQNVQWHRLERSSHGTASWSEIDRQLAAGGSPSLPDRGAYRSVCGPQAGAVCHQRCRGSDTLY
jgi:hypothetical protein